MIFIPTQILIRDQQTIQLIFSSPLSIFITKNNFLIMSMFSGVKDLDIISISIEQNTVTINVRPQFPDNLYLITLLDLPTQIFQDINGVALSTLTDARNIYFVGTQDINLVRDTMLQNLPSNYVVDQQTLVYDIIATIANELNEASIVLNEIKNDNFISIPIVDELYFRGAGPTDRLKNEGAYDVFRVAKTITSTNTAGLKTFDPISDPNIPFEVINLRVMQVSELVPNGITTNNFNEFLITLSNQYITKLISVVLNPGNKFYDPTKFGYSLLNNNYDRFARSSPILQNNQVLLSPLTNNLFPEPIPGNILSVVYEFDDIGKHIDYSSVSLFTVLQNINENVPPSVTTFFLKFANIVNNSGQQITSNGVRFQISPSDTSIHPAFIHELVFNSDSLPSEPGEYAINYTTGQGFVFGTQQYIGTGITPPIANYYYKNIAIVNIDYFVNDDGYAITLNSSSQFAVQKFTISYLYEKILTPDIDYVASTHIEVLNERINNKLIDNFTIQTNNGPIKDIVQILNETTGEIYTPGLIEENKVSFIGNNAPTISISLGELAAAGFVDDEILNVGATTMTPDKRLKIFLITLSQNSVLNQRQDGVGSSFNTSTQFTRTDVFVNEFYFNNLESIQINLEKIRQIGDYLIDYSTGKIYICVTLIQNFDIGHISYAYGVFIPQHKHVLAVSSIGLGITSNNIIKEYAVNDIQDGFIIPESLSIGYDMFDGVTRVPNSNSIFVAQLQDNFTLYTKYPIKKINSVFTQNDVELYNFNTLITKNLFNPSVNMFNNTLIDLNTYVLLTISMDNDADYYKVIIQDDTTIINSIIIIDNGVELLDTDLNIIKYNNIIIKNVVPGINSASITLQNLVTLVEPAMDRLVDSIGNKFLITSVVGASVLNVTISDSIFPIINIGSQILNNSGVVVINYLIITGIVQLPDLSYTIYYSDTLPNGVFVGYQVKDSANNTFIILDVQDSSVIVSALNNTIPIIDSISKIETQSILSSISAGQTKLMLPLDAPVSIGTNLKIGYIPAKLNNSIIAANAQTGSAGGAGMVIDYSFGQFFIDYTHLDDELLISYDWGDNQLDWSISDTLNQGDPYYVSYKYGASRDGLETNFGPLTNVDFLQNAPLSISRETYRTAVSAAIKSFLKGSTHEAVRLLVHSFTQIDPDIEEAILNQWIVGREPLSLQSPEITGDIVFGNGKYSGGLIFSNKNSIQLPGDSSLRLAQGTFSTWLRPSWSGAQADEKININLPVSPLSIYYNAHFMMPQDVTEHPWTLVIDLNTYGTAYAGDNYIEVHNSKNEYTTASIPINDGYSSDGYLFSQNDGYYPTSSILMHNNFTEFPHSNKIGRYIWNRAEPTLSIANDFDINFSGYITELTYVNPAFSVNAVSNIIIDDGYGKYDAGFYLFKKNIYISQIIFEDVHLSTLPPFPHINPPIFVSTVNGSNVVSVISGDTATLSVGQAIIIGMAYPNITNILSFTLTTITLRDYALTTQNNIMIGNLDPVSDYGTQDGYGEVHLNDKLGTRATNTIDSRKNGWDRQLLVELKLIPSNYTGIMSLNSNDMPLTTQVPVIDLFNSIIPGIDILVDGYGNVFEIDHIQNTYVWLKKPSASNDAIPFGNLIVFRKVVGVRMPDQVLTSIYTDWSLPTSYSVCKQNGNIILRSNEDEVKTSYVLHYADNSSGISGISFGQIDLNVESTSRIQSINYNINSILTLGDIYIGNTGNHPIDNIIKFKYNVNTTGIPAIQKNKYFAIFTSESNIAQNEPVDEIFIKIKIPQMWELNDGINTKIFYAIPVIHFSASTDGEWIDIVDGYGMTYRKNVSSIDAVAIDNYTYVTGNNSILIDNGPELRISAGKKHFLFDVKTPEGSMSLYRSGAGFMTAEIQTLDSIIYNIRANISKWVSGELHHIAMSWKISSPDETDELHLFIDGDEVPNEVSFGSDMPDGYFGQVYQELITIIPRIASIDGYIINDVNGSGIFITSAAIVQPDLTWIDKTIVINAIGLGPNIFLNEPLIIGSIINVIGGKMLFLSQNNTQIDFSIYGPSTPILYGLATSANAEITSLVRTNFGIFKNGIELSGPNSSVPQFRQVNVSQTIELYDTDTITGQYIENVTINDIIGIMTYGLLTTRIKDIVYQYGSLIRNTPIVIDKTAHGQLISVDVAINSGGPAFITDLPPPVEITQVIATKILLPRTMI